MCPRLRGAAFRSLRHHRGVSNNGNLVASHPGNVNAVRHGLHSSRVLAPRAQAIAEALMELPHVVALDRIAADQIGAL